MEKTWHSYTKDTQRVHQKLRGQKEPRTASLASLALVKMIQQ